MLRSEIITLLERYCLRSKRHMGGVYGVPETFVIDRDGRIVFKLVRPIVPDNLERSLRRTG